MFHELLKVWFSWVETWGYAGVFLLMALESSIVPVPSELVMPPAAFWAAEGRMSFGGIILAGTLGSYFGSAISYLVSKWVGSPILNRYGKYVFLPPKKVQAGHRWVEHFGTVGVFFARLLPVMRHLVSIPAGLLEMPFLKFSVATTLGAGIWCFVLAWFGGKVLGGHPELLQSPEAMVSLIRAKLQWMIIGIGVIAFLLGIMIWISSRLSFKPREEARGTNTLL